MISRLIYTIIFSVLLLNSPALAKKRVALVIGNSNYQHTQKLKNPINDATAIAASLKRLNFEVVAANDVTIESLAGVLSTFVDKLNGADVGLFYYAGHGISFKGKNFIVPVDAKLSNQFRLRQETTPIDQILSEMSLLTRINLVFLDACRDNPLAETLKRSLGSASRSAAVSRGLSLIDPGTKESLVVFATEPGKVADDGPGKHSPFTQALLKHIERPGIDIEIMLKAVQRDVKKATNNRQRPERVSKLESDFSFNPSKAKAKNSTIPSRQGSNNLSRELSAAKEEQLYWDSIKDLGEKSLFQSYLNKYPNGKFTDIAQVKIKKLNLQKIKPEDDLSKYSTKPSFNCAGKLGIIENLICNNPHLAQLDNMMAEMFFRAKGRLNKRNADLLVQEQRFWLTGRKVCLNNVPCVGKSYRRRIERLKDWGG